MQINTTDDMIFTTSHNEKIKHGKVAVIWNIRSLGADKAKGDRAGRGRSKVSVSRILKNNLEPVDGLTILHQGENVARAIWLNPLYQKYEYGIPVERIAEEILEYHKRNDRKESVIYPLYGFFESAGSHRM